MYKAPVWWIILWLTSVYCPGGSVENKKTPFSLETETQWGWSSTDTAVVVGGKQSNCGMISNCIHEQKVLGSSPSWVLFLKDVAMYVWMLSNIWCQFIGNGIMHAAVLCVCDIEPGCYCLNREGLQLQQLGSLHSLLDPIQYIHVCTTITYRELSEAQK